MRNVFLFATILVVLSGLGTWAWVSHNPESPHLEQAQEWPVVGELVRKVREAYLGPDAGRRPHPADEGIHTSAASDTGDDQAASMEILDLTGPQPRVIRGTEELAEREERVAALLRFAEERDAMRRERSTSHAPALERPAVPPPSLRTPLPVRATEWRWFLPGQPLHSASSPDSETLDRLSSMAYLPVLFRVGDWTKVRYDGRDGWIDSKWQPPHSEKGARRGFLREKASPIGRTDWEAVRVGKEILGVDERQGEVAGYDLYTDLDDERLLQLLSQAAGVAEDAFFARYGRLPSRAPRYALLLFSRYQDYERFSHETANVPLQGHRGHAGRGLIALTVEGASSRLAASGLVHEITHILVARALTPRLPPWLNEGMATDLGSVWVEDSRDLVKDWLVETEKIDFGEFETRLLHLERLVEAGSLTPLVVALSRDRESFYGADSIAESYAQSAAFVRYLLEGEDGTMASGFLQFLDAVAKGWRADLLALLGRDIQQLDEGFRAWILEEAEAAREGAIRRYQAGREARPEGIS